MRFSVLRPRPTLTAVLLAVGLAGCAGAMPPAASSAADGPLGSPFADGPHTGPLLIDLQDLAIGTTVEFDRMPTESELHDLGRVTALRRIVVRLDRWPDAGAFLDRFERVPREAEAVILLRGYPPTRAAADAWNRVNARLRIILIVEGPPVDPLLIADLNVMRALDRVIAEMDDPSRAGFERLQRPLSFVKRVR